LLTVTVQSDVAFQGLFSVLKLPAVQAFALTILCILAALLVRRLRGGYRSPSYQKKALKRLAMLEAQAADPQGRVQALRELPDLLRRTAKTAWNHPSLDTYGCDQWLAFLDATCGSREFHDGVGCIIPSLERASDAALASISEETAQEVFRLAETWLRTHRRESGYRLKRIC